MRFRTSVTTDGPTRGEPAPPVGRRTLGWVCGGSVGAAALLWGATAVTWYVVEPSGRPSVALDGTQVAPLLTGLSLLALAGVAGIVATGGVLRRVLGGLLAVAGGAVGVIALRGLSAPAIGELPLPSGVDVPAGRVAVAAAGPVLALAGGVMLLLVGMVVAVRERRLPRFGARFAAPGARPVEVDPDRAAWQDLDAGRDPTAGSAAHRGDDPGDGVASV